MSKRALTVFDFMNALPRKHEIVANLQLDGRIEQWYMCDDRDAYEDEGRDLTQQRLAEILVNGLPRRRFTIDGAYTISGIPCICGSSHHALYIGYDNKVSISSDMVESFSCHIDDKRINDSYLVVNLRDGGRYALFLYDGDSFMMWGLGFDLCRALSEC